MDAHVASLLYRYMSCVNIGLLLNKLINCLHQLSTPIYIPHGRVVYANLVVVLLIGLVSIVVIHRQAL